MALYKVLSDESTEEVKVERFLSEYGARAVAIRKDFIVFETTGHREETNRLMEALAPGAMGVRGYSGTVPPLDP